MTARAFAVALAAGAVVLAGCGAGESGRSTATTSPVSPTTPTPTVPAPAATTSPTAPTMTSDSATATRPDSATATTDTDAPEPPPSVVGDPEEVSASGAARLPDEVEEELDASGYGSLLSTLHAAIVDPASPYEVRSAAGERFQLVLRSLAGRPELDEAVLDSLEPSARPSIERIIRARQYLRARSETRPGPPPPTELPAWTIIEPEPVPTLLEHYAEAEALTGIPWYWLAAIHLQETRMGRIRGVSSAGAVGPMQFLPTTWEVCCQGDPTVTRDAIIGAATYLAQSGGPDDMPAALYRYNPNDGYVAVVTAYAETLRDEPELYVGYHGFQVFFGASIGTVRLPIGYEAPVPVDAAAYVEANPADAAS